MPETFAISAAQFEAHTVLQYDNLVAVACRAQLFDLVDSDDTRSMDANKFLWIEPGIERADFLAHQMRFFSGVEADIIGATLEPFNVIGEQEGNTPGGSDDQPFQIFAFGADLSLERFAGALVATLCENARD